MNSKNVKAVKPKTAPKFYMIRRTPARETMRQSVERKITKGHYPIGQTDVFLYALAFTLTYHDSVESNDPEFGVKREQIIKLARG